MPASIKTAAELEKMRVAGQLAAEVLEMIEPHVQVGVTTGELDRICHEYIVARDAIPAPLNTTASRAPSVPPSTTWYAMAFRRTPKS